MGLISWTRAVHSEDRHRMASFFDGDPYSKAGELLIRSPEVLLPHMLAGWRLTNISSFSHPYLECLVKESPWDWFVRCWAVSPDLCAYLQAEKVLHWTSRSHQALKIRERIKNPEWADKVRVMRTQQALEALTNGVGSFT